MSYFLSLIFDSLFNSNFGLKQFYIVPRLDPKELQQSQSWNSEAQRKNVEVAVQQELHTVDFDPESQTKHY